MLFFKVSYKTSIPIPCPVIFFWELSDPHSYHFPHCLWPAWQDKATLLPHPLPNLKILNVQLTMLFFKVAYKTIQYLFPAQWYLLRAFRSSLLPHSTLCLAGLARQSYSLIPSPTQSPNPQCSQLTMLLLKISYKTIQFLFPAQWSFTDSFQIPTPTTFHTVLGQLVKTELLSLPTPTKSPNP